MAIKLSNKDYIWSCAGTVMSLGSKGILFLIVLFFLDNEMYGLWAVFQSLTAIAVVFDFGFSTTFGRNINYCWNGAVKLVKTKAVFSQNDEPNFVLMKRTMTACKIVFFVLSLIAFVGLAIPGTMYILHISSDLPQQEVLIAWSLFALATFLNLYYNYYRSFMNGVGAISAVNRVLVFSNSAWMFLTLLFLFLGFGIIGTGFAYLLYSIIFRLLSRWEFYRYKEIGLHLKEVEHKASRQEIWDLFKAVWHNASREGLVTLANYLTNQACVIIAPLYMSLTLTGMYSLAMNVAIVIAQIALVFYSANQPVLQAAYVMNNPSKTKETMALIVVSFLTIFFIELVIIIAAGLPILNLIRPEVTPSVLIMLTAATYQFLLSYRNIFTSYFSGTNRIPYAWSFIGTSLATVGVAVLFLQVFHLGIWGLLLGQIVCQIAFNVWYWPLKAHQEMHVSIRYILTEGLFRLKELACSFIKTKA